MTWGLVAVAGGTLAGGYLSARGSKDAAQTGADAASRAAQLEYEQYLQSRQDQAPYRAVATGTRSVYDDINDQLNSIAEEFKINERGAINEYWPKDLPLTNENIIQALQSGQMGHGWNQRWSQQMLEVQDLTRQREAMGDPSQLTEGALNTLAQYGTSQVDPGAYIPESAIPEYQRSVIGGLPTVEGQVPDFNVPSDIPQFDVQGNIPGYNLQNAIPDFNLMGDIPEFNLQSDIPRLGTEGDIPEFNITGDVPQFDVQGNIPEFDSTLFDIYKDPSYEWRKEEMLRGLDRTSGAMGQITSGNRLNEIMERTGEMASQEYGAARDRMVQDYGIRRQNEATQYGRDVTGYEYDKAREADIYGRDVLGYDYGRSRETDQYGRALNTFEADRAREADLYGRGVQGYGFDRSRETDIYGRGLTDFDYAKAKESELYGRDLTGLEYERGREKDIYGRDVQGYDYGRAREADIYGRGVSEYDYNRANALTRYGFDVDAYNRAYGINTDQYGRDLTAYNADVARENTLYGRGVGQYGRAYGQEGDYLNRLASLSNIGQTAVNQVGAYGANAAQGQAQALQDAGAYRASGQLGQANAWSSVVGDLANIAGRELPQYFNNTARPAVGTPQNASPVPIPSYKDFYW